MQRLGLVLKLLNMFTHKFRYLFIILLGVYSYANTYFSELFFHYNIVESQWHIVLAFVLICLFVWESNRFLSIAFSKKISSRTFRVNPLISFFLISNLTAAASGIASVYIVTTIFNNVTIDDKVVIKLALMFAMRINLFLHCINGIVWYINQNKQKDLENEEFRRISSQAELQAIKNQINPHFLFNNLNVLSSLVMNKNEDAPKFIDAFSSVYRYILNNQDVEMIKLEKELEFINPYIFLLKKRFGEGLHFEINISDNYMNHYIVPVALQLLIENSIKHNIVSTKRPLTVTVEISPAGYLTVKNNLQLKQHKEPSKNWGLNNINQRFKLLTDKEIQINQTVDSFIVDIPLIKAVA